MFAKKLEPSKDAIKKAIDFRLSSVKTKYCAEPDRPPKMRWCKKCLYPASSASPLAFDENGICTGCQVKEHGKKEVDWGRLESIFKRILDEYRGKSPSGYDCIIPVSGGKDSYYQIHLVKNVYKMNPLLVTYNGNNWTATGTKNLNNMREVFDCDHVYFTPSIRVIKAMNRLGMLMMGDMNWHAHSGIFTYPFRVAVDMKIPLVIYGEHGMMEVAGMHSYSDLVEFTYRYRHEHGLRGYEWYDFMKCSDEYEEKLTEADLICLKYPNDDNMSAAGVRGLFISSYFPWDGNKNYEVAKEYGFQIPDEPFERTYRKISNLDDMHENGMHDYMKWVKFGYGRATDHCCKDIRAGLMTREEGIEIVKKMDHIKSKDLYRWLEYVGWSEEQFDLVADTFRDPRVWWKDKDGRWKKDNIWDEK